MFGSTQPTIVQQDLFFGDNDIVSAKAIRYRMVIEGQYKDIGYTDEWGIEYMNWLFNQISEFEKQSELLKVYTFDNKIWEVGFLSEVGTDAALLVTAFLMIFIYSFFVLGACSPIHMRVLSAIIGLSCVGLSISAGYGLSFIAGYKFSDMHGVLPFLILGLGVDDMFVIVNTIDQTPDHLTAK